MTDDGVVICFHFSIFEPLETTYWLFLVVYQLVISKFRKSKSCFLK